MRAIVRFNEEKFRELQRRTGAESENELINAAFSLLHWATDRLYEGYDDIAAVRHVRRGTETQEIDFDFLTRIKQLARRKKRAQKRFQRFAESEK